MGDFILQQEECFQGIWFFCVIKYYKIKYLKLIKIYFF